MRDWLIIMLLTTQLICMLFVLIFQFRIMDKLFMMMPREITVISANNIPQDIMDNIKRLAK